MVAHTCALNIWEAEVEDFHEFKGQHRLYSLDCVNYIEFRVRYGLKKKVNSNKKTRKIK